MYSNKFININEKQEAFILDHGKLEHGVLKYKDDFTSYSWNTRQNNKLKVGALVLNRRPGKLNKDKKFEIYGGGRITHITEPDSKGNVVATISDAFKIDPSIRQGDQFIEDFQWTHKNKKTGTWEHFWNQYGINAISVDDFKKIIDYAECRPFGEELIFEDHNISENELKTLQNTQGENFKVNLEDGEKTENKKTKKIKNHFVKGTKIDYDRIQKQKNKIGALGEEIVFNYLENIAKKNSFKQPVHISKIEGDGYGYDIIFYNEREEEIYIEVKATTSKYLDGFEMTQNEIKTSQNKNFQYKIYRIYELDLKNRECKLKIYDGPIDDNNFVLETKSVKVYQK